MKNLNLIEKEVISLQESFFSPEKPRHIKMTLIGENRDISNELLNRYLNGFYRTAFFDTPPIINARNISIANRPTRLQIVNSCGLAQQKPLKFIFQEHHGTQHSYVGTHICGILVDLKENNISSITDYLKEIKLSNYRSATPKVLIGVNSQSTERKITDETLVTLAKDLDLDGYGTCDPENDINIFNIIHSSAKLAIDFINNPNIRQCSKSINAYIHNRQKNEETYYYFFSKMFGGFSKNEKLNAAETLKKVLEGSLDSSELDIHKEVLSQGKLGRIYKKYKLS